MKLLNKENEKEFQPFELKLLVETEEEARLLYHVFNRCGIRDIIFTYGYDKEREFNKIDIAESFSGVEDILTLIESKVKLKTT